jgi:hypothetical protein
MEEDPSIIAKERVQITMVETWRATVYRFAYMRSSLLAKSSSWLETNPFDVKERRS